MKTIMILGAGIYQVPLIQRAKEKGYRTVVVSIPGSYPGFDIADKVYFVNTTDKEACLKVAIEENISAVCTTGTDVALPTLGYICDTLKLHGPSENTSILSSNKALMKDAFVKGGVHTAQHIKVSDFDECKSAAFCIGYPCILKVVDSSGSRGIKVVRRESELEEAYKTVLPFTRKNYFLVEKFLDGEEFGAQAFVYEGELLFSMTHSDIVFQGNTGVPVGHCVPYSDNIDLLFEKAVFEEIKKSIKALGIDNAAINADFILCDGVPYVLEIGARCGATCLAELVSLYYDINYYDAIIDCALGCLNVDKYRNLKQKRAACGLLITSDKEGVFNGDGEVFILKDQIVACDFDLKRGDKVRKFLIGPDRIGQIISFGQTSAKARNLAYSQLKLVNDYLSKVIE